jgi:hypothetical protein
VGWELGKMAVARIKSGGRDIPNVVVPTKLERRGTCRPLAAQHLNAPDEVMAG